MLWLQKPERCWQKELLQHTQRWRKMWRRILILNIREMVSFRGRCRNKNANPVRTGAEMWCGLLRLAKRWSPHIGRWWGFLQGLLYQRWRLLQEIKGHKSERLWILLYLQTAKGTFLWSALLWHGLNAISKSFCSTKGFTNRFCYWHMHINVEQGL